MKQADDRLKTARPKAIIATALVLDVLGRPEPDVGYPGREEMNAPRVASRGRVIGRKKGLTSPAVQRQLRAAQPNFGVLFDGMQFANGAEVPISRLRSPKVEAEEAFILVERETLAHGGACVHSSFPRHAEDAEDAEDAEAQYDVGVQEVLTELSRRQLVGNKADMNFHVTLNIADTREAAS